MIRRNRLRSCLVTPLTCKKWSNLLVNDQTLKVKQWLSNSWRTASKPSTAQPTLREPPARYFSLKTRQHPRCFKSIIVPKMARSFYRLNRSPNPLQTISGNRNNSNSSNRSCTRTSLISCSAPQFHPYPAIKVIAISRLRKSKNSRTKLYHWRGPGRTRTVNWIFPRITWVNRQPKKGRMLPRYNNPASQRKTDNSTWSCFQVKRNYKTIIKRSKSPPKLQRLCYQLNNNKAVKNK